MDRVLLNNGPTSYSQVKGIISSSRVLLVEFSHGSPSSVAPHGPADPDGSQKMSPTYNYGIKMYHFLRFF